MDRFVDVGIIIVAFMSFYGNALFYWKYHKLNKRHWVKLWYAVISLIWAFIFTYILVVPPITNTRFWHSVIIEPAIIVTLAALAASAIMRIKVYEKGK